MSISADSTVSDLLRSHRVPRRADVPITLATLVPYIRRNATNTDADRLGWLVAHHDIIDQAAKHGAAAEVHLFSASPSPTPQNTSEVALAELRVNAPVAVRTYDLSQLNERLAHNNYVFLAKSTALGELAHVRAIASGATFPICSILHAVHAPDLLGNVICALLMARPYDTIVATSKAASRAFAEIRAQAIECIRESVGVTTAEMGPQLHVIPLAVDDAVLEDNVDRAEARRTLGLDPDATILLWIGRFTDRYKADLAPLLTVAKDLASENVRVHLLLAGQDSLEAYASKVEQAARTLGLGRQVSVVTSFQPFLKRALYGAADIFVSPVDNIQESFGLSLLEAMARGLPVIASDWSGYRDLVLHGDSGLLVRTLWTANNEDVVSQFSAVGRVPATEAFLAARTIVDTKQLRDAIRALSVNAEQRVNMGANGRRRVRERYRSGVVMEQFRELWLELLAKAQEARAPEVRRGLRIAGAFRQYATTTLSADMEVRPSKGAADLLKSEAALLSPPPGLSREVLTQLLNVAAEGASVGALSGSTGTHDIAVRWLLKKGYLEIGDSARS